MIPRRHLWTLLLACFLAGGIALRAEATQVITVDMPRLARAELAFTGICTNAESYRMTHPKVPGGLVVTTYTFEVAPDAVLKGEVPRIFSFTQWGAPRAASRRLGLPYFMDIPHYAVGKEYAVFLTSESELGLRSTIGLGGGKFNVLPREGGGKYLVNDFGNHGLLQGLGGNAKATKALNAAGIAPARTTPGPIDYDAFVDIFRSVEGGR